MVSSLFIMFLSTHVENINGKYIISLHYIVLGNTWNIAGTRVSQGYCDQTLAIIKVFEENKLQ